MLEQTDTSIPASSTALYFDAPHKASLHEIPNRQLEDGDYYVQTLYSGISAGTELTFFMGTNPKSSEGWNESKRLFRGDIEPSSEDIFPKLEGYMEVGLVTASRNPHITVGSHVAMMYHHKSGHIAGKDEFVVVLPDGFDPLLGIWVSKMGPICMNGILYAADDTTRMTVQSLKDCLAGQRVAVFGAGMIGLLTGLFAKWAGASEVVIVDSIAERLDTAAKLGLTPLVASVRVPEDIKEKWVAEDAMNTGADIVFQCTGSNYLLQQAFESLREQGVVIDLGFYQQGANHVMFGKEFHHNRLRHICAQIGALPRHQQKDWTKLRLSEETIAFMQEHGPLLKEHLVTHVVPLSKGQEIFDALAARDPSMLQVVLTPEKEQ